MTYRFESCELDTERRELRQDGAVRAVEPQVFDLLQCLIENRGRVVSKDELLNVVWDGRAVSDATLNSRINAARNAIGDSGREQRLIRTIRGKGFRFVGTIREQAGERRPPSTGVGKAPDLATMLLGPPSLAVLPFREMSGDAKQQSLADAITEELITSLAKVNWFSVVSRQTVFALKGAVADVKRLSRRLGARYIMDGSVRVLHGRLRITLQLVDSLADRHIWSERYEGEMSELAAVQDQIVDSVVAAIGPHIYYAERLRASRARPERLSAWQCVMRALSLINTREKALVENAQTLVQQAYAIDPTSAQSQSLMSFITTLGVHQGWQTRASQIPLALQIARDAKSLNSDEPWAHLAVGYANIWIDPELAIAELQKALTLDPNLATAHYLIGLTYAWEGCGGRGLEHGNMAERLSPRDLLARGNAGIHHNVRATACFALGQYRQGIEYARKAVVENPSMPTAHRAALINLALAGDDAEARRALQIVRRLAPDMSQRWIRETAVWARREDQKKYREAFRIAGLKS